MSNRIELFENKLKFDLPEDFTLFENELDKYIYCIPENGSIITVCKYESTLENNMIEKKIIDYVKIQVETVPGYKNIDVIKKDLGNEKVLGLICYLSFQGETTMLNYYGLLSVDGKETIITAHCMKENSPRICPKLLSMFDSVAVVSGL